VSFLPWILLTVLGVAGGTVAVVIAFRGGRVAGSSTANTGNGEEQGLVRLTAEIHTGWEQTLIGLTRELHLPRETTEIGYGALYLETRSEHRVYVRSRSEIGRGFLGVIDITPRRGPTLVTYSILRLPGDQQLHSRVLDLELLLIAAARRLDPGANIHLAADALREFDRPRTLG
jgi:hypothetical protein